MRIRTFVKPSDTIDNKKIIVAMYFFIIMKNNSRN